MNVLIDLFGRFHPLLVHLPISFLLLAILLQWLSDKEKYAGIQPAVRIVFLLGMISAILSCLSGWLLSSGGEYDEKTLGLHRWFGITLAVGSVLGYRLTSSTGMVMKAVVSVILVFLIVVTGHLGGTLTHGEGFLTKGIVSDAKDSTAMHRKVIRNVQEAQVFADIVQPLLKEKCGSCHSATKQKGGLRLDGKEWILKGGKDGQVFSAGNPDASELYTRILLSPLEEDHMPPKGKPQLTEQEVALLHWWISNDGSFEKKVREIPQPDKIKSVLLALQSDAASTPKSWIPDGKTEPVPQSVLDTLRHAGIIVLPVAVNSNYLLANFVSIPRLDERTIALLSRISKQLVWLKLGYAELSEESWKRIGQCINLTRLSIEHTNLTDASVKYLSSLGNLQYLNLVGTKVSVQGIQSLTGLVKLEKLYLGQTLVHGDEIAQLRKAFPKTQLDSGNYRVENLATDTQLLKAPSVKR